MIIVITFLFDINELKIKLEQKEIETILKKIDILLSKYELYMN